MSLPKGATTGCSSSSGAARIAATRPLETRGGGSASATAARRSLRVLPLVIGLAVPGFAHADLDYDFTPVTQEIASLLAEYPTITGAALIVTRDGGTITQQYFGANVPTTMLPIASASKWLSALVIERLVEAGVMSWSDTVGEYIPNAPADKLPVTLGQLFSHTAGFPQADDPCLGDQSNYTLATCAQEILSIPLTYPPGTRFSYTGNGMQVGGWMAEIATGQSWDQIFQEEVATPLGMTRTDYASGSTAPPYVTVPNPYIAGGVRSTVVDYGYVVQMVAQHGYWNGTSFLSPAGIAGMQEDQTHGVPIIYSPDPDSYGYGYGEWRDIVDANGNAVQVSSTGKFATSPWVDNDTGVGAVFFTFSQDDQLQPDLDALWANVRAVVTDPVFDGGFD
ncbi:MAG: serine hydrolase domain-containing protein [Lysobacterales bacterium]